MKTFEEIRDTLLDGLDQLKEMNKMFADPEFFGEFMRKRCFKAELGGYECFDLVKGFRKQDAKNKKWHNYVSYMVDPDDDQYVEECSIYYNKQMDTVIAWHWDSDGTLIITSFGKTVVNDDCKKCYGWEFIDLTKG